MKHCDWDSTNDIGVVGRSFIWGHFISFFIYLFLFRVILPASNNKALAAVFLPHPTRTHARTQRSSLPPQSRGKHHLGSCLSNVDIVLTTLTKSLNIAPLCEFATLCTRQPLHSQRRNMQTLINLYCFLLFVLFVVLFFFPSPPPPAGGAQNPSARARRLVRFVWFVTKRIWEKKKKKEWRSESLCTEGRIWKKDIKK